MALIKKIHFIGSSLKLGRSSYDMQVREKGGNNYYRILNFWKKYGRFKYTIYFSFLVETMPIYAIKKMTVWRIGYSCEIQFL